jgi:hypothetical protein
LKKKPTKPTAAGSPRDTTGRFTRAPGGRRPDKIAQPVTPPDAGPAPASPPPAQRRRRAAGQLLAHLAGALNAGRREEAKKRAAPQRGKRSKNRPDGEGADTRERIIDCSATRTCGR